MVEIFKFGGIFLNKFEFRLSQIIYFKKTVVIGLFFFLLGIPGLTFAEINNETNSIPGSESGNSQNSNSETVENTSLSTVSDSVKQKSEDVDNTPPAQVSAEDQEVMERSLSLNGSTQTTPISVKSQIPTSGVNEPNSGQNPGAFMYSYALVIPPGRNGMTPNLLLGYSSRDAEDTGFGYGWSISIPFIERLNKTGFDALYSTSSPSTSFHSSFSGELVKSTSTLYVARNNDGSNLQYTYSGDIWIVKDKEGNTYEFGTASSSRQDDPASTGKIFKWMLKKITDPNGNSVTYSYVKDLGQIYPASITYTDTSSSAGPFTINFTLGLQATSSATSTATGFPVKTRYQVNQVSVLTNGTTTQSYLLTYSVGDNKNRTVLKNVTERGHVSSTIQSLPPTTFTYSTSTPTMATSSVSSPISNYISNGLDLGVNFADVNGDGWTDVVQSRENWNYSSGLHSPTKEVYINATEAGWNLSGTYIPRCFFNYTVTNHPTWRSLQDGGGRMVDLNGDALPDMVCGSVAYLNNGTNWATSTVWNTPVSMNTTDGGGNSIDAGVRFADVNGDGLLDILKGFSQSGTYTNNVYLNTGNGWATSTNWIMPFHLDFTTTDGNDGGGRVVDLNNDNLVDLYYGLDDSGTATSSVYINNGKGWNRDTTWNLLDGLQAHMPGLMFSDLNLDGLVDVSVATATLTNDFDPSTFVWNDNRVYINTGTGWRKDTSRSAPVAYTINGIETSPRTGNVNGWGYNDLFVRSFIGNSYYNREFKGQGEIPDLLHHITESGGRGIDVDYSATSFLRDNSSNNISNPKLSNYFPVVTQIGYNDGVHPYYTETYHYSDGSLYFASSTDRRFAGFEKITKYENGQFNSYFHTGNTTSTSTGEYLDNQSKIGKVYRTEVREPFDGVISKVVITKWNNVPNGASNLVVPTRTTTLDYDELATHKDSATESTYSTTTGNLTQNISWGEVAASNDGSFTDVGTDKVTTNLSYAASTTAPLSLKSQVTSLDQSSNIIKDTKYFYDGLALGSTTKGNLTEQNDLRTGTSTYIKTTRKTYNPYGLVTQELNPRNATTTYSYDALNLYPATTTNPLGHVTTASYNYVIGQPTQIKDPNGSITKINYDPLNRITSILRPDDLLAVNPILSTTTTYIYTDSGMPRRIQETKYLSSSQTVDNFIYLDGVGREVQTRTRAEDSNTYKVKNTFYNHQNRVEREMAPYFGIGASYTNDSSHPDWWLSTWYDYDKLGRVKRIGNTYGDTINTYANWKVTTTDPLGKSRDFYKDSRGNLISVVERVNATTATTTYTYDVSNNLTLITDALGNVRNFTYDKLGRILTAQDLHAPADTSFGTTTYAYDDAGNLTQLVTPRAKTITYTHDVLNRVLTENSNDTAYVDIQYGYDNSPHANLGNLTSVSTPFIGTLYDYDRNNNLYAESHVIPGTATTTTWYYYNQQNNLTHIVYPDNATLWHGYNAGGLLEQLQLLENGTSTWTMIVSDFNYSPVDQITFTQRGNNTASSNGYDPGYNYRLFSKLSWNPSIYLQYTNYGYDGIGNINTITDYSNTPASRSVVYTYDDLYRLTSASTTAVASGPSYKQTYTYNAIGNLLTNAGTSYLYQGNTGTNYANPHAATSIGGTPNTYDQAGNLITNGTLTNTWDYRNQLTRVVATVGTTTATSTYGYNQRGERVSSAVGTSATYYPNDYYSVTSGGLKSKYIYANRELIAIDEITGTSTPKISHSYADHLGGTVAVTNNTGGLIQSLDYYPFGQIRLDQASTTFKAARKYIGEFYDPASDLSYLNARHYDGKRGRFISQDPVFLAIGNQNKIEAYGVPAGHYFMNPQSLNSYSYAVNSPIQFSDPQGLWYGELSGSVGMYGLSGSLGIRFNEKGMVSLGSVGLFAGAEFSLSGSFSSGDINIEQEEITVSRGARLAVGPGIGISSEGSYDSRNPLSLGNNRTTSYSTVVGLGGGIIQEYTKTQPLIKFESSSNKGESKKSTKQKESNSNKNKSTDNTLNNTIEKLISVLQSYIKYLQQNK